jgi:hypothetical protein
MEKDSSGRKESVYRGNWIVAKTTLNTLTDAAEYCKMVEAEQQLQVQKGVQDSVS